MTVQRQHRARRTTLSAWLCTRPWRTGWQSRKQPSAGQIGVVPASPGPRTSRVPAGRPGLITPLLWRTDRLAAGPSEILPGAEGLSLRRVLFSCCLDAHCGVALESQPGHVCLLPLAAFGFLIQEGCTIDKASTGMRTQ